MIRGLHAMFYSSQAEELRVFLRDKLGFDCVDVGDGWLIFNMPEADLGVHPTEGPHSSPSGTADISFYCDDLKKTIEELTAKGVEFAGPAKNAGFGLTTFMKVPGDFQVMLYQPLYKK
jgi:hypothetical protein